MIASSSPIARFAASLALAAGLLTTRGASADVSPDGSFTYAIDVEVPTARSGVGPHLSFAYSSHAANGPVGVGWQIAGLAPITRVNYGNGILLNSADTFSGPSGRLIKVGADYHGENEDWARYVPSGVCGDGPCTWTSYLPDGNVIVYEGTPISGGLGNHAIRVWFPTSFTDPHGNGWTATYFTDPLSVDTYPSQIQYDAGDATHGTKQVTFVWEDRPDAAPTYAQGTRVVTARRLSKIRVTRDNDLFREYRVAYEQAPGTGRSRATSIVEVASDGTTLGRTWGFTWDHGFLYSGTERKTQSMFLSASNTSWGVDVTGDGHGDLLRVQQDQCSIFVNRYVPSSGGFQPEQVSNFGCNMRPHGYQWIGDFNGDGLVDMAIRKVDVVKDVDVLSDDVQVFTSKGDGTYAMSVWTSSGAFTAGWGPPQNTFAGDFDGDGKTDIATRLDSGQVVVRTSIGNGFVLKSYILDSGSWGVSGFTGDFDGDGRTDILSRYQASNGFYYMRILRNRGGVFLAEDYSIPTPQTHDTLFISGDFNGDGKTDLLAREPDPSKPMFVMYSDGLLFEPQALANGTLGELGTARILGDFNGDGRTDFAECDGNSTAGWLVLSTGNGFTRVWDPQRCDTPPLAPKTIGLAGDYDGDGLTDNVGYSDGQLFLHRTFSPRDVLTDIAVGAAGAAPTISIDWEPAPSFALAVRATPATCSDAPDGTGCGQPNASPRLLVKTLTQTLDPVTSYATDYDYENGRFIPGRPGDSADLGFEFTSVTNRQTGVRVDTTFHQKRPFQGMIWATLTSTPQGLVSEVTNGLYRQSRCTDQGCVEDDSPFTNAPRLVRCDSMTNAYFEAGQELYFTRANTVFDPFGAPAITTDEVWRGASRLAVQTTQREFLHQPSAPRVMGLPTHKRIYAADVNRPWLEEIYAYDGLPNGMVGATVDQTSILRRRGSGTSPWETVKRSYDSFGNLLRETNVEGLSTTFEYSADGRRLVASTDVTGRKQVTIDPRTNSMIETIDGAGVKAKKLYDVWGFPIEQRWEVAATGALLRRETASRSRLGDQETECRWSGATNALSFCTTTYRDSLGREFARAAPLNTAVSTSYDAAGFPSRVSAPFHPRTGPSPVYTLFEHDAQGRVTKTTEPDGAVTQYLYNDGPIAPGAVTRRTVIDPQGRSRTIHEDAQKRPLRVEEPPSCATCGPTITQYAYDDHGDLLAVVRPDGTTMAFSYDDQGNREAVIDPSAGTTITTFHKTPGVPGYGKLATETRPAPNATTASDTLSFTLTYDASGRLASRTATDGTSSTWTYDDSPAGMGRVAAVTHDTSGVHVAYGYSYDLLGRESSKLVSVHGELADGTPIALDTTLATKLDGAGAPLTMTFPDGSQTSYSYSPQGLLNLATLGSASVSPTLYEGHYYPRRLIFGNGVTEMHEIDAGTGRILSHALEDATHYILRRGYAYDGGELKSMGDTLTPTLTTSYQYDAMGRLALARRSDGTNFKYAFDAGGNLTTKTSFDAGGAPVDLTRTIEPGSARLATDGLGDTLAWSVGGNLLERGGWEYRYDAAGQLATVARSGAVVERHVHDHEQHRIISSEPRADGALVTYDVGGVYLVRQRIRNGVVAAQQTTRYLVAGKEKYGAVIAGDAVLEPESPNPSDTPGVRYYHADPLGSTALVTGANAAVLSRMSYSPYGEIDGRVSSAYGERIGFVGTERQQASGLWAMGLRSYDPALGIFTSPDTRVGDPLRSVGFGSYLYAAGNPVKYVDRDGRFPFLAVGIAMVIGAVIGGTDGGILTDPAKWMDWQYMSQNWSWGKAAAGAAIGGTLGYGYASLDLIGGTFLGVQISALAQSAALGGSIETAMAWHDGRHSPGQLAAAFGVGAFDGFLARSGFGGAADIAINWANDSVSSVILYGAAMAADSVVESLAQGTIDSQAPLEVSFYGLTFSHQRDGTWTRRFSFALFEHWLLAGAADHQALTDFGPLHHDKIIQAIDRGTGNHHWALYTLAYWTEMGLFMHSEEGMLGSALSHFSVDNLAHDMGVFGATFVTIGLGVGETFSPLWAERRMSCFGVSSDDPSCFYP